MATKITIPVEFQAARDSATQIIQTLEQQLAKVRPGTAIYDGIKKQIDQVAKLLGKVNQQFQLGYSTSGDISRTEKDFIQLATAIDATNKSFARLDASALNLNITEGEFGNIATQIKNLNTQLLAAQNNLRAMQNVKVQDLFSANETKKLNQFSAKQRDTAGLTVYNELGEQIYTIGLQAEDAQAKVESLQSALAALQQKQAKRGFTAESTSQKYFEADQIYNLTGTSAEKIDDVRERIMQKVQEAFKSDGAKKSNTDAIVTSILTAFEIDQSEVAAALTAKVGERQEKLRQLVYNVGDASGKGVTSDKVKRTRSRVSADAKTYREALVLETDISKTSESLNAAEADYDAFEKQLKSLRIAFQSLQAKLQAKKVLGASGSTDDSELQAEVNNLKIQVENLNTQLAQSVNRGGGSIVPPNGESGFKAIDAQKEAEAFKHSMENAVKQWFSVQQIINIVKTGIRQAYRDIQGLDKAMTNIAVVTDMSVGELWGKINEYMSIAQQYGVSTQGVYEVSQLYYQQGLGTADVMAATTETLKMARIAGMDYADAADAMTVAIRSFKMEMTDAAHVTDVYSKVAAVTASDSEELAIAMSKTASSAESVGSSFENTTAMLAVMIETTRESAQNLGSALKSIISRYGEMKVGATVDAEGEALDYNKVDTALKSVGISIKDAQGQFRDFDDVIFELSSKWDTLDKNTQRYIATIMAGNRQQSRFIALVDNWERLEEVAGAAEDSEDAGLLQYAKTLDSLETKLNNIKTSFQEFYMSIFNGPLIGKGLDFINDIIQGFNKLSKFTSILNIASIVSGLKLIGTIIVNTFSASFGQISVGWKQMLQNLALNARAGGQQAGQNFLQGSQPGQGAPALSGKATLGVSALSLLGTGLSFAGSAIARENQAAGAVMSSLGSGLQIGTMVGMINPLAGIITGSLVAIISGIASWPSELEKAQQDLQKAKEAAEETNIERAKKKEEARNLETTINNLEKLQKARYQSEEAEQAFIDASNSAFEQFPQLTATFDETGNAIIDVIGQSTEAEWLLIQARQEAADATYEAAAAELKVAQSEMRTLEESAPESFELTDELSWYTRLGESSDAVYDMLYNAASQENFIGSEEALNYMAVDAETLGAYSTAKELQNYLVNLKQLIDEESMAEEPDQTFLAYHQWQYDWLTQQLNGFGYSLADEVAKEQQHERDVAITEARIKAGQQAVGYAYTDQLLTNLDPLKEANWREITGSSEFLQKWAVKNANFTEKSFKDGKLTEEAANKLSVDLFSFIDEYTQFTTDLGYQLEDFNSFLASADKGQLSLDTFNSEFKQFFGQDENTWGKVAIEYKNSIKENLEANLTRLTTDLGSERLYDWSTIIEGEKFTKAINSLPVKYFTYISDFANDLDSRLDSGVLTSKQATDIIDSYLNTLNLLQSDNLNLSASQIGEAQRLISEAAGDGSLFSITGLQQLANSLQNLGIDVSQLNLDQIPVYTANLVTEWANLEEQLVTNLDQATSMLQKASQGMELEEALKLSEKAKIDWSNFKFIDGKWYTNNLKAIESYYTEQMNALIEQLDLEKVKLLGNDEAQKTGLLTSLNKDDIARLTNIKTIEEVDDSEKSIWQYLKTYYNKEDYDKWFKLEGNANKTNADYWIDYFSNLGKNIDDATQQALEYWTEESRKNAESATRLANLRAKYGNKQEEIQAYETIASQGKEGYSDTEINDIIGALGWQDKEQYYDYDAETGTYNLTDEGLQALPIKYRNIVISLIDSEAESAKEAMNSLATSFAQGNASDDDYQQAFANTLAQTDLSEFKTQYQNALNAAIGDSKDYSALKDLIRAEGTITDETEITKAAEQMVATYRDELTQNNLRFIELSLKQLDGTITDMEALELKELNVSGAFKTLQANMTSNGEQIVMTWAQLLAAITGSGLDWSEIEDTLEKGYSDQLERIIGKSEELTFSGKEPADSYGLSESLRNIREAEGVYTKDIITSLLTNLSQATGKEINLTDDEIEEFFKWDSSKGAFSFTGDAATFYKKFGIEAGEVLNYLQDAFVDSENRKALNDAIKKEDLQANFAESFAQIYNNLGEATLKDINELYNSVYGENALADNQEDFKAINKAILNNDTAQLAEYLLKIAKKAGFEIDDPNIQAQLADMQRNLAESILTNIQNAIEGSLSETDLLDLGKQLNLNLNQFAFQTANGMQLNEEGMLRAAAEFTKKFGSGYNIAGTLVDSFAGTEHMLGSYERVTDLINEATNNTSHWAAKNTEVLSILRQIQAQYMLMESDKQFDFMNYDPMQGGADNWKTFTDNVSSAMDVLKTAFESGSKIDYTQISSIISWLGSQGVKSLGATNVSLEQFNNTILSTMDAVGQVDLAAAAVELGIGISDMASAFDTGIDKVADQQIAYWSKYKAFLEGIKKLQEASDGIQIEPPKLAEGKTDGEKEAWIFKGQSFDTQIDAYKTYVQHLYSEFEKVEPFKGKQNPIAQIFSDAFNVETGTIDWNAANITQDIIQQVSTIVELFRSESFDWVKNAGQFFGADGTFNLPLFLETQIQTSTKVTTSESDGATEEEIEKPVTELEKTLASMGAEKTGDNTYTFAQDNLQVSLDISTGAISFSFAEGSITPDPEAVNKILKAAGYLSDGTITFKQDNMSIVLSPTSGTVTGDFSNITGEAITESDLLAKLGIINNNDGTITFITPSFNATIIPSSGVINSDLSKVTGQGISDEDLLAKLGIVKNESGYSFTALDGTNYNFTVGPTGIAVFDSSGISTEGVSTDALLVAILAKALSGWNGTGTSYTYNDGSSGTYTYKANGTSSYDISGISINSSDLAKKIEESNLDGWSGDSTSGYTYNGKTATFIYNASGKMNIVPSKTDGETPTMGALLKENFSEDIYAITGNDAEGWKVAAKDGTTLFTIPAGIKLEPTKGSSLGIGEDGVISGLTAEATITANTDKVVDEINKFNGHTVEVNLQFGNAESQLVDDYSNFVKDVQNAQSPTLSWKYGHDFQSKYKKLAQDATLHSASLTKDDLNLLKNIQAEVNDVYENTNKKPEGYDVIQGIIDNASAATDSLSQLADVFNSLSSGNLGTNLISFVEVLTSLISLNTASLDLSQFINQLNLLGNIQLNEEQLLLMSQAAQALANALAPLSNATITIDNLEALSAIESIQTAINGITGKTVTITVRKIEENIEQPGGPSNYAGTVNGLAYADGNAYDRLIAGAHLVNKTLVGELGPELAVYDNQYHLLGQNGAEFVNLPSNALVFNHRQTEGILKGQNGHRGKALVNGNVSGPAAAGGIDAAIAAVDNIIKVWSNLKDATTSDLVNGGGGGGGGGGDPTAHIEDLQEWYNLSRKIADVEQEINNIMAERENLTDGRAYLRSLRKQQELLQSQISYQETLLNYQKQQLQNQADEINNNKLWSQFIHVGEDGLLQYNKGNETNGGKGALEVLQDLNEMSGKEQIAFMNKIGYSYTNTDGKKLEGEELVAQFFTDLQSQIDNYDALRDTVHETKQTLEELETSINEINQEIIDNQLELETEIYDLIVKAWEKEIEKMEEYADAVEEANEKYIEGLQDALDAEQELYEKDENIADRESLQRQLALLRRSGGSASEIASLEEELSAMLKDEYFTNQQDVIDDIQKTNEAQLEALQQQIQLEEDALAFEQENGLIWNKVSDIMSGGFDSMMNFFTANDSEFFEASALAQIEQLDDWAKRVGIYDEDQAHQKHEDKAKVNLWDNNAIWDNSLSSLKAVFDSMKDSDKKNLQDATLNAYANAKLEGKTDEEATNAAKSLLRDQLQAHKDSTTKKEPTKEDTSKNTQKQAPAKYWRTTFNGTSIAFEGKSNAERKIEQLRKAYIKDNSSYTESNPPKLADFNGDQQKYENAMRRYHGIIRTANTYAGWAKQNLKYYSQGGLVDYTGTAVVHGSPSRPEAFLNAEQTEQIRNALIASNDSTLLNFLRKIASQLDVVSGKASNSISSNRSIEIAQGAVQVQVGTLANSYDVEDLSNDIMGRIVAIADKSTNRSVSRR